MKADLFLTADSTPGFISGSDTYNNTSLVGYDFDVERRGFGTLQPGVDYNKLSTGGFKLLSGTFQSGEIDVLHFTQYVPVASISNYTNGFDIAVVLPELQQRIGWRQPTKAGSPILNSLNKTSKSGRFYQGFHALVTIDNIKATVEEANISDASLNQCLQDLQDDAIMRTLTAVFKSSELIEQQLLYTRFGTMDLIIQNFNMFCGFMINIADDFGISAQINNCTLYFDGDVDFNLYLFQDGVKAPLKSFPVHCDAYQRNEVRLDNLILNFKTGRKYYFGYFQSDLGSVHAIQEQIDRWATGHCFEAIAFAAPTLNNNTDFNHNYRQWTALPRGLNLEIITFRDHTQQILRKANLFDEAIGLTVAVMVLEQIQVSTRSNVTERQTKINTEKLYVDLNQAFATAEVPITPGLKSRVLTEYKALRQSFFPEIIALSGSMESDRVMIDDYWYRANYRQITNPPIMQL
jgi:hypothetical protein